MAYEGAISERFWSRVEPELNSGCWLWTGGIVGEGYGGFRINGKAFRAHRLSWEILKGEILGEECVLHKCDTPACVNPDHLFLGTRGENNSDRHRKGRNPDKRGSKHHLAKLSEADVLDIMSKLPTHKQVDLAKMYKVSQTAISNIKTGIRWSHLGGEK